MRRAFFSIFQVEKVVKGVGAHVLDILGDRRYFLADVGVGDTASEALTLVSRVLPFEDFIMTSGAALPADEMADLSASLISFCLKREGSRRLSYESIEGRSQSETRDASSVARVGRNDPCPCGSGKKYKKCCGQ